MSSPAITPENSQPDLIRDCQPRDYTPNHLEKVCAKQCQEEKLNAKSLATNSNGQGVKMSTIFHDAAKSSQGSELSTYPRSSQHQEVYIAPAKTCVFIAKDVGEKNRLY